MNKNWRTSLSLNRKPKRTIPASPILFDEDAGTSSTTDEVKIKSTPTRGNLDCSSPNGHSTPKGIQNKINYDSTEFDNESPIEPLTQNPPTEVGWDFQRIYEENSKTQNTIDPNKTPKRSNIHTRRKNSNSPVVFHPLKKRPRLQERKENLESFMVDFQTINQKICEKKVMVSKVEEPDSQLIVEMDVTSTSPSDESDIKLRVSADSDESLANQNKAKSASKKLEVLLNDSIDDFMIKCSQEVEAREFGNQLKNNSNNSSEEKSSSKKSPDSSLEKVTSTLSLVNVQALNFTEKTKDVNIDTGKSSTSRDSGSLEIPDDSFDELFVKIDEKELCKAKEDENLVLNTKQSNKCYPGKINNTNFNKSTAVSNFVNYNQSQSQVTKQQTKVINSKATYGYLNNYVNNNESSRLVSQFQVNSQSSVNNSRLFKAKSFSDSNFLNQVLSNKTENKNVYSNNSQKHKSIISKHRSESNFDRTVGITYDSTRQGSTSSTNSISSTYERSNSNSQKILFTPEEIEKKRLEALMKRQEKLKKTNSQSNTLNRPIKSSIIKR